MSNPTTQGVTLRGVSGSGASRTLVLADGVPLNDPFGSWVYWNRVPQAAVERVEIVRGATGDLYGADALGGVVQVLTFAPGRTRLRTTVDGGSHDTARFSGYGGTQRDAWSFDAAGEWLGTDGVVVVGEEARGPVDVPADSDYVTGFLTGGYHPGVWHATLRLAGYSEERGNGTPEQVNTTGWRQLSGEAGGSAAGGAWIARGSGGTQDYYQTFTAVAADRASERLTTEQTTPSSFGTISGQWSRGFGASTVLAGAEGRWTKATVEEIRYSITNVRSGPFFAGGNESLGALFGRASFAPREALTVVVGLRADFWESTPDDSLLPAHSANFVSPRASASCSLTDEASLHAAVYHAHRTPTLNELHRGFRVGNVVTNPNPQLDPETLTGLEGGFLFTRAGISTRVTAFWNELDGAITNVTIASTPALITRQRQNTDTVRAAGIELETDVRWNEHWTFGGLIGFTHSTFVDTPAQPAIEGNRVPQVPLFQFGGSVDVRRSPRLHRRAAGARVRLAVRRRSERVRARWLWRGRYVRHAGAAARTARLRRRREPVRRRLRRRAYPDPHDRLAADVQVRRQGVHALGNCQLPAPAFQRPVQDWELLGLGSRRLGVEICPLRFTWSAGSSPRPARNRRSSRCSTP